MSLLFLKRSRRFLIILSALIFSGCAVYAGLNYDQLYGRAEPQHRIRPSVTPVNQDSLKQRLTSLYIYEHLFVSNLYFTDEKNPTFFKIVRSKTAPGQPVDTIATRRP